MVDYDVPINPTAAQLTESHSNLGSIIREINNRSINSTIYVTRDVLTTSDRLYLTVIGRNPRLEFALNGNNTGEKLSSMPYSVQKATLEDMLRWANSIHVCGIDTRDVRGFRPQLFAQNQDTYGALDAVGMIYDSGFKAGIQYLPGHENDVWPYPAEGHKFYAVPVSTIDLNGEKVFLQDKFLKEEKSFSANQWNDLLTRKFDQAAEKGEPVVAIFSISLSGSGDYLKALSNFLDYSLSKNAKFVTTMELVDITKAGGLSSLAPAAIAAGTNATNATKCAVCDSLKNVSVNTTSGNDANASENASEVIMVSPIDFSDTPKK